MRTVVIRWLLALLALLGAVGISFLFERSGNHYAPQVLGKNNTVLFLTTDHYGYCNVHLATAFALLQNQPHIAVHYASITKLAHRVKTVSRLARNYTPTTSDIVFHPLPGKPYLQILEDIGAPFNDFVHPPGLQGVDKLTRYIPQLLSPWVAGDYFETYEAASKIIREVDPAIVALDLVYGPAIDATLDEHRAYTIITPNILSDIAPPAQSLWSVLSRYPATASGHPFPLPWHLILPNMYLKFRVLKSLVFSTHFSAIKAELKAKGLKDPANMHRIYKYGTPWITQTLQHNHWPMGVIPPNLTLAGPINLAGVDLDPVKASGLLAWTRNAPTVLISFGTIYNFTQEQTRIMLDVIEHTLERIDVQVLWKLDTVDEPYNKFLQQATMRWPGRLRIEKWLDAEPASLLQSGHVKAFVHHGGASSFHDALAGGVPHIILPQWSDLYDYAQLAEELGIGIWACRKTSPDWTVDGLTVAFMEMLGDNSRAAEMAKKAKAVGERARANRGRDVAAQEIAKLAATGF